MSGVSIAQALSPEQIEAARDLFLEYASGLDFSLGYQGFSEELRTLPGRYGPPTGCLLVAHVGGLHVGCVALREIDAIAAGRICEMKRLYVRPAHRTHGAGRRLAQEIIARGRSAGYTAMRLDTGGDMIPAQRLYKSLGFRPIARYNSDPDESTLYFELRY